ncbi:MAG TPA: acyltransferase [Oscillospiraceae bacterium]|nr:acyltransferase [Gammaproteobacteria bacterium]HZK25063.1 acyltransferase [Oscillospiraceae bacterium]
MRHRVYLDFDVYEKLPEYAGFLNVSLEELQSTVEYMLQHNILFEENEKILSISSIDIEDVIENDIAKRFYAALKKTIPSNFFPNYGKNWATVKDRCLRIWEQVYNIIINKIPSHTVRIAWLRLGGAKIGKGSTIWRHTEVLGVENLVLGEDSTIAWHCQVDARAGLVIGDHVAIASHVLIVAGSHDLTAPEFWSVGAPIYIEDYVWVASRALIAHGARLRRGCVVTANTVVAKEIPAYKIIGGTGAKAMGERPHNLNYKVGGKGLFTLLH